jgi:cellulose synthase/poly-beta-1,6-N-acetylglucosamine synthase-like glycosyltransferase
VGGEFSGCIVQGNLNPFIDSQGFVPRNSNFPPPSGHIRHASRSPVGSAPTASVIMACYGDADIVERNLAAFVRQTRQDFEVVIADDGSPESYRALLERWAPRLVHPIQHVRHEDLGFRKTRIQNRAVSVSRADRLIFIDADCLPHRHFVRNHLQYLEPDIVLSGRRTHVARQDIPSAEEILNHGVGFSALRLLGLWLRGRAKLIEHGVVLPISYEIPYRGLLGCNFSIHKANLEKINGFNAEFVGPGWEDTDIDFRLQLAGVKIKTLRHKIVEYHVDHTVRVWSDATNQARLIAVQKNRIARAPIGLTEIREGDFEHWVYGAY